MPEAVIDTASNGPTTIIPAVSGKTIVVKYLWLTNGGGATDWYFSDGATKLHGAISFNGSGSEFEKLFGTQILFTLSGNSALNLTQTGSRQLSGRVYYDYQ